MADIQMYYTNYPGWTWNLLRSPDLGVPAGIANVEDGKYKVKQIVLTLARIKNELYPIYNNRPENYGNKIADRGQVQSPNPINISLTVEGQTTQTLTITDGPNELQGVGNVNGVACYTTKGSQAPATTRYEFNFSNPPVVNRNTRLIVNLGSGYVGGNTCGITIGVNGWKNCYWVLEENDSPGPGPGPGPVPGPTPSSNLSTTITDLSGASRGNGVLKDYTDTLSYSGCDKIFKGITSTAKYVTVTGDRSSVTITANSSNLDFPSPTRDIFTITCICGHDETYTYTDENGETQTGTRYKDTSFTMSCVVTFYEKIKRQKGIQTIVLNARDAVEYNIGIQKSNYVSLPSNGYAGGHPQAHNAFRYYPSQNLKEFIINSDTQIPLNQYFTLASDSGNKHKISEDYQSVPYKFRFFNSDVQTEFSDKGTYKMDLDCNLTICCAPSDAGQFSYDFLDRNNNIVNYSDWPEIFLIKQEDIMLGNLTYENYTAEGGYCRAFRCIFRDYYTKQVYHTFDLDSQDTYSGTWSGKILHIGDSNYNALPFNKVMELVVTPYFYFDDSFHTAYSNVSITIGPRFLKVEDYDLVPKLIFPILSKAEPWTPMMLQNVERFGYEFIDVIYQHWGGLKSKFGINIGGYDLFLNETQYFTYTDVVKHIIFNIGLFVSNNAMYEPALQIKPFVITMVGTPQEKRIYAPENESVLCTTKESMWTRPLVEKGDYLRYFDAERFMQFINKYKPLNDNQDWIVPIELRGYIIDTDFWLEKEQKLNTVYVKNMHDWLYVSPVTNEEICWVDTVFKHKKGEYFIVKGNLTTHDYLHDVGFTHDKLHKYTHNQIRNLSSINNLKQNYYDLLVRLRYGSSND